MKKSKLFILLILLLWIQQSGHSQVLKDTSRTYNITELRVIADTLLKCQEYRKLLNIANQQLVNRDFAIVECQKETRSALNESLLKEKIITGVKTEVTQLKVDLKLEKRKLKWAKVGWLGTSAGLLVLVGYFIIH